jgi:hypothetical protein
MSAEHIIKSKSDVNGIFLVRTTESELWLGHNEDVESESQDVDQLDDPLQILVESHKTDTTGSGITSSVNFVMPALEVPAHRFFSEVVTTDYYPSGSQIYDLYFQARDYLLRNRVITLKPLMVAPRSKSHPASASPKF